MRISVPIEDGYDETLVPLDYMSAGQIRDDLLFTHLVGAFKAGVTVTCIMDCCHSGTVLDLPFVFKGDGSSPQMGVPPGFNFGNLAGLAALVAAGAAAGGGGGGQSDPLTQAMAACGACLIV